MVSQNNQQQPEAQTPTVKMPIKLAHQDGKPRTTVEVKSNGRVYEVGID